MTVASALAAGRRAAESRMTSRATIRRKTGRTAQNPDTGRVEPVWDTILADSRGRMAGGRGAGSSRTIESGGEEVQVATREWHAPMHTAHLWRDDDLIDVASGACAGRTFRVIEATPADATTALRMPVVEVARPTEWG